MLSRSQKSKKRKKQAKEAAAACAEQEALDQNDANQLDTKLPSTSPLLSDVDFSTPLPSPTWSEVLPYPRTPNPSPMPPIDLLELPPDQDLFYIVPDKPYSCHDWPASHPLHDIPMRVSEDRSIALLSSLRGASMQTWWDGALVSNEASSARLPCGAPNFLWPKKYHPGNTTQPWGEGDIRVQQERNEYRSNDEVLSASRHPFDEETCTSPPLTAEISHPENHQIGKSSSSGPLNPSDEVSTFLFGEEIGAELAACMPGIKRHQTGESGSLGAVETGGKVLFAPLVVFSNGETGADCMPGPKNHHEGAPASSGALNISDVPLNQTGASGDTQTPGVCNKLGWEDLECMRIECKAHHEQLAINRPASLLSPPVAPIHKLPTASFTKVNGKLKRLIPTIEPDVSASGPKGDLIKPGSFTPGPGISQTTSFNGELKSNESNFHVKSNVGLSDHDQPSTSLASDASEALAKTSASRSGETYCMKGGIQPEVFGPVKKVALVGKNRPKPANSSQILPSRKDSKPGRQGCVGFNNQLLSQLSGNDYKAFLGIISQYYTKAINTPDGAIDIKDTMTKIMRWFANKPFEVTMFNYYLPITRGFFFCSYKYWEDKSLRIIFAVSCIENVSTVDVVVLGHLGFGGSQMIKIGEIPWDSPGPIVYSPGQDELMGKDGALWNACGLLKACPITGHSVMDKVKFILKNMEYLPGDPPEEISVPMTCFNHLDFKAPLSSIGLGKEHTVEASELAQERKTKKPGLLVKTSTKPPVDPEKAKKDARWKKQRGKRDAREEAILKESCISSDPVYWDWKWFVAEVCEESEKPSAYDPEGTKKAFRHMRETLNKLTKSRQDVRDQSKVTELSCYRLFDKMAAIKAEADRIIPPDWVYDPAKQEAVEKERREGTKRAIAAGNAAKTLLMLNADCIMSPDWVLGEAKKEGNKVKEVAKSPKRVRFQC